MIELDNAPSRDGIMVRPGRLVVVLALVTPPYCSTTGGGFTDDITITVVAVHGRSPADSDQGPRTEGDGPRVGRPSHVERGHGQDGDGNVQGEVYDGRHERVGYELCGNDGQSKDVNAKGQGNSEETTNIEGHPALGVKGCAAEGAADITSSSHV